MFLNTYPVLWIQIVRGDTEKTGSLEIVICRLYGNYPIVLLNKPHLINLTQHVFIFIQSVVFTSMLHVKTCN
jgi:hypothetical protein